MTERALTKTQKSSPLPLSWGQICFGFFSLFCLFLLLRNAELAISYIHKGLLLCARTVIPSLFPFMVLSELLISGGADRLLPRWLARPMERLLFLPREGCCAILLGWICGFPVGARCVCMAYDRGSLSKEQAERALCISNSPSSAFLINAVGISLWDSRRFGLTLYATVLGVSLLYGILLGQQSKKRHWEHDDPNTALSPLTANPLSGAALFTQSVRSATGSILLVCAYILFFSAFVGTLGVILGRFGVSVPLRSGIFAFFEISGGMSAAAELENAFLAACLSAFAAGWSGLSVHFQVLSVSEGRGLSFGQYFRSKLLQGLLCALIFGILLILFPSLTSPTQGSNAVGF